MSDNNKVVPISIIIAGIIISGSILHSRDVSWRASDRPEFNNTEEISGISSIRDNEPILGNPKADFIFIEYSDTECPFSLEFSREREKVMGAYGAEGRVAWVYRSVPTTNVTSLLKAISLECVAESQENYKYWNYLTRIQSMDILSPEDGTPQIEMLLDSAARENISPDSIEKCIENERHMHRVRENTKEALAEGAKSTPFTVILLPFEISTSKRAQITSSLADTPAEMVTIPAKSDRIFLNGFIPAELIGDVLDTLLSF